MFYRKLELLYFVGFFHAAWLKRQGPTNTTLWQHTFLDLAILFPRDFGLYKYMKKCYCDLAVLFEIGLPGRLFWIQPKNFKLDPAGISLKKHMFFSFFDNFCTQGA